MAIAYAAGINLYATVAITGLFVRLGGASAASSGIAFLGSSWVIAIASILALAELVATSMKGIAAAWETVHSLVRPPGAAILAAAIAWQSDPLIVLVAALVGGATAMATHAARLGLRYALDATRRRAANLAASIVELMLVAVIAVELWEHPILTGVVAIVSFAAVMVAIRTIWHALRQVFTGHWMPAEGLMQAPRASEPVDLRRQSNSPA